MFGFGFGEILLLTAIGLIVLGPKQLPQVARVIGRTIGELKKALHDVSAQVAINLDEEHRRDGQKNQAPPPPADTTHREPVADTTHREPITPIAAPIQVGNYDHHEPAPVVTPGDSATNTSAPVVSPTPKKENT